MEDDVNEQGYVANEELVEVFTFELGQDVSLKLSEETGVVKGRAEYLNAENTYLVLYKSADGRQVEGWWSEGEIEAV
jgi:hypothetical protein